MNLNFTMTEVNESMMNPSAFGGSIIGGEDHLQHEQINHGRVKKRISKQKPKEGNFSILVINIIAENSKKEKEIKLNQDQK